MTETKKYKHFFIDFETVNKENAVFTFDLFLFQPVSGSFILDLPQNSPLTEEKISYLSKVTSTGAKIAISLSSMDNYLQYTGLKRDQVPGLDYKKHPLYLLMQQHEAQYKDYLSQPFNYLEGVRAILRREDFSDIIKRTKAELCQFPFTKSSVVSLAHQLAHEYLHDQKVMNKTVALAYSLARLLGIDDEEELSHLVVACFYRDIGMSQISYDQFINQNPQDNLEKGFQKHPALSLFLLNKSNLKLEPKTMKIIMDHHELFSGRGYPGAKREQQLELSPQIIGLADHIVSFASGHLVPGNSSYLKVFKALAKGTQLTGMQHGYHPSLVELLIKIVIVFDEG